MNRGVVEAQLGGLQLAGQVGHGQRLAAALGVPHHAALLLGLQPGYRLVHGPHLLVARQLLHHPALIELEQHEVAHEVDEGRSGRNRLNSSLSWALGGRPASRASSAGSAGHDAGHFLLKHVVGAFQEQQPEDVVLKVGAINAAAQDIGRIPEPGFESLQVQLGHGRSGFRRRRGGPAGKEVKLGYGKGVRARSHVFTLPNVASSLLP